MLSLEFDYRKCTVVRSSPRQDDVAGARVHDMAPSTTHAVACTKAFLFTDVEGSTRLWETSADMARRVEQHFGVLRAAVQASGGEVFATLGDGIAAAFSSVGAAVQAAVEAQQRMPATGLAVRMGVHTGAVERVGDDYRGPPVNRAARVADIGHGGQILLSDVSAELVRSGSQPVGLADLGVHRLRDLSEPERVWQVIHPDLRRDFPPVRGVATSSSNLPAQRSSLVGRELDVRRVTSLVERHRVVTLTGVGGVGKTRLAIRAAADLLPQFANAWFISLVSVADGDDVARAIAHALGAAAVTDPLGAVSASLGRGRTLLVLDNCEHVVDSAAAAVDALMDRCGELSVIATSREALGIDGEHVVAVRPLDPATTAVDLFIDRVASAGADVASVSRSAIEGLCRRLDGIPLAIELAAAATATLGVSAVVGELDDRWAMLSATRRRTDRRHSTMWAAIEWSYRLLEPTRQQVLQRLAVFPSGLELDAAHHVAATMGMDQSTATETVASLVRTSMLQLETHELGTRYRMLETVRAFALAQLDEVGDRDAALGALAGWMTTLTDLPFDDPCNAAVERNTIRLEREADTWREAMVFAAHIGSAELAASLCGPPVAFFLLGRHELAEVVRPLLPVSRGIDRHRRAVLCALIVSTAGTTDPTELQHWVEEIEQIDGRDPTGLGALMRWVALAWQGDFAASVEVCTAASLDQRFSQATRDMLLGIAVLDRFSLTDATDDPRGLISRALEVADRSDVALHRACCLLGAAWGLVGSAPDRSLGLVRRALTDIADVPALTRLTLPGSASRLLAMLDPRVAAQGLLEQLDATTGRRSFVDLIPLFYGAALVDRVGHDADGATITTSTISPIAPSMSMMDSVDLARRAAATGTSSSISELEAVVRSRLTEIAAGAVDVSLSALSA